MKKILIIEDDDDILKVVTLILSDSGFETTAFKQIITVREVIKIAPQLILLDTCLPDDSNSFCLELKNNPESNYLPIVLFSAAYGLKEVAKRNYADAYIKKPFDLDNFLTTINQYIL
jgi:DNA-binding response OmpR family regulator